MAAAGSRLVRVAMAGPKTTRVRAIRLQLYSDAAPASSGLTLEQGKALSSLPAAKTPIQLSGTTISQLLNGARPDQLPDGYRFRRALNTSGTKWQEATVDRRQTSEWTWALRSNAVWSNAIVTNPDEFSSLQ